MEGITTVMELFKDSDGWKQILEKLDASIDYREQILLGKINPEIIDPDMNKIQYNKYDLLRLELYLLEELKCLPDNIIKYNNSIIDVPKKG